MDEGTRRAHQEEIVSETGHDAVSYTTKVLILRVPSRRRKVPRS